MKLKSTISRLCAAITQPKHEEPLPPTVRPATYQALEREVYVSLEGEETTVPVVALTFEAYCAYLGVDAQQALRHGASSRSL